MKAERQRKVAWGERPLAVGECCKGSAERTNILEGEQGWFGRFAVGSGNGREQIWTVIGFVGCGGVRGSGWPDTKADSVRSYR